MDNSYHIYDDQIFCMENVWAFSRIHVHHHTIHEYKSSNSHRRLSDPELKHNIKRNKTFVYRYLLHRMIDEFANRDVDH